MFLPPPPLPELKKIKIFYEDYFKGPYQSLRLMQALCGKVTLETALAGRPELSASHTLEFLLARE